jgi:outer membrane immunogenic protein
MKVKGLFLASAAIAALPIGAASAADLPVRLPVKAAPMSPPPFNWTGFYVGANAGAIWSKSSVTQVDTFGIPFPNDSTTGSGFIGGVQAGYNWQFSNIVLGAEADIDFASVSRSVTITTATSDTHNSRLSALGTARGRIGFAFDRFLPYVTGGVAFASLKNEYISTFPFAVNRGSSATGWTVGGGLEYAFDNHWSAKAEYLYAKFPDKTVAVGGGSPYIFNFSDSESIARAGINYRF